MFYFANVVWDLVIISMLYFISRSIGANVPISTLMICGVFVILKNLYIIWKD